MRVGKDGLPIVYESEVKEKFRDREAKLKLCTSATKIMGTVTVGKEKFNLWPRDKKGNLIP